jgi:tetratricopeptide (TPR) repeat protein
MLKKRCLILCACFFIVGYFSPVPHVRAQEKCNPWVCKVVSIQGQVLSKHGEETSWQEVKVNDTLCPGDRIRVENYGRAAVVLSNDAVLRLDQNTTVVFSGVETEKSLIIRLLEGATHFFSRKPRGLKVVTPFVNGVVEGTEFLVEVRSDRTFISLFEGRLHAENEKGDLDLVKGTSMIAREGQAPQLETIIHPRDAVQWALYYPPLFFYRPDDFSNHALGEYETRVRESVSFMHNGDLSRAFGSLEGISDTAISDPHFFTYRAGLRLTIGDVSAATKDIQRALSLNSNSGDALALLSVIAVTQNRKAEALEQADQAIKADPTSGPAWIAASYSRQAAFDLEGAVEASKQATLIGPENALAWSRLAELHLSFGYLDKALEAAQKSISLNPNIAHTQSVLGFAYLTQIKIKESKSAFEKAISLDSAAPLPRLGLGLATIREGHLEQGRAEIEIAAGLDPDNSLLRSYLGKAYFEEKRDPLDGDQFEIAKQLDPNDPTPWFYDAIRKQTLNRPVEALHDLQKSIELNDNRAVYRSRFLLDEDLAVRSASLARIYNDLGFGQLALVEGWKSENRDPSNSSAHRFLSDTYAALPRHEIARISELLQAQLLQPTAITPVQPSLAESHLDILPGTGPGDLSLNEYNQLFNRNRMNLQTSVVLGKNDTLGDETVLSSLWGPVSASFGQFHYENDGFRDNDDQSKDIFNVFSQVSLSSKTSLQAEYRHTDTETGDLFFRFDPNQFYPSERHDEDTTSLRVGGHHAFSPNSHFIVSYIKQKGDFETLDPEFPFSFSIEDNGRQIEAQQIYRATNWNINIGAGYFNSDRKNTDTIGELTDINKFDIEHSNFYLYSNIIFPENLTWTFGTSGDFVDGELVDTHQYNPKLGVIWEPGSGALIRSACFRTIQRTLISSQTIEPTQVAGFNQFFADGEGADAWRYGIGYDQKITMTLFTGYEFSHRKIKLPFEFYTADYSLPPQVLEANAKENLFRAYFNWLIQPWISMSIGYQYEDLNRDTEIADKALFSKIETHRFPIDFKIFYPNGISAGISASQIYQQGKYFNIFDSTLSPGNDHFWIIDTTLSYRFPKRWGQISIEAKNLSNEKFKLQDTNPGISQLSPERTIYLRLALSF